MALEKSRCIVARFPVRRNGQRASGDCVGQGESATHKLMGGDSNTLDAARARRVLIESLTRYEHCSEEDRVCASRIRELVEREARCAERDCFPAHLTGSAWLVNARGDKALLLRHAKLNKWLQPGGHADGSFDLLSVALREACEESGLSSIRPLGSAIFDVDIHAIPARPSAPEHFHYDVRFLFTADEDEPLSESDESEGLRWVSLSRLEEFTEELSVTRLRQKWLERRVATS